MDEFGPVIYNLYGSTEMAWATIASPQDLLRAPGTVGRPPPQTRVLILDETGRRLPPGETGRIFVGHEMLFEGYTDGRPGRERIDGMLTAGDLGHVDSEGRLFVDTREDDMNIADVAVVGAKDADFGERPVAFVVPESGHTLDEGTVDRFARERLSKFKVPRDVVIVPDLPRNAIGKVLRRELHPPTDEGRREVG
jgi:acyl-CoA synthetase (AMP-forming)/AMP-acid ligase II